MAFFAVVLFIVLAVWFVRWTQADRELARLRRELDDLRARVRRLEADTPPSLPPPAAPPPLPAPAPPSHLPTITASAPPPGEFAPRPIAVPVADDEDAGLIERAIGERWLLYAGVVVLLLAIVFFLRYAFERNWLSPSVRVVAGGVAGLVLVAGGRRLSSSGYRNYGLSLAGAGFAVLYLSVYAALNFYALVSPPLAFVLLAVVSAAAAWMADLEVSPPLAVVAVVGGFATPFLVGGREDAQLVLFTYDALLVAAVAVLAFRREWWYLHVLTLALTVVTVGAWAVQYYAPSKALRTELFLTLYCAMFLVVLRASLAWTDRAARRASSALLAAPVLYHFASIAILYDHPEAFLVYTILASTVALVIAERANLPVLRGIAWLAVAVPLAEWLDAHHGYRATSIVTVAAVYGVYLTASLQAVRTQRWTPTIDALVADANGLGLFAALSIIQYGRTPSHLAAIAVVLAAWNALWAVLVTRLWDSVRALHWWGIAATLLAIAIAIEFEGPWIVVMWAVEGTALVAIAVRSGHYAVRVGGWALLAVAIARWAAPDVQYANPLSALVLNARTLSGFFLVALMYALAWYEGPQADREGWRRIERAALFVGASVLTVVVVSREIDAYWTLRAQAGEFTDVVRQAMLSAFWALYAAVAIAVGFRRHYRPIRYFAIALFGLTVAKILLVDLDTLAGIDRIVAFLVVGVVLLFASFLYQRGRSLNR